MNRRFRVGLALLTLSCSLLHAAPADPADPVAVADRSPRLMVRVAEKSQPLALEKLDARVFIDGFTAETTLTMTFRNDLKQQLDGELIFPLPEGAVIRRYGLDIEGVIVDGVVVEKHRARISYESEIRKGIDPGLVEHVVGNNFRTRIWPIPAKGTRTIRVQYVETLATKGAAGEYKLPTSFGKIDGRMSLFIEVARAADRPTVVAGGPEGLAFDKAKRGYFAEAKLDDAAAMDDLVIRVPDMKQPMISVEGHGDDHYFTVDEFPAVDDREAPVQRGRIGLFWDASLSRANSDKTREYALVRKLVKHWGKAEIDLVIFRNKMASPTSFTLENGDAEPLIRFLESLPYDGGTNLGSVIIPDTTTGFHSKHFLMRARVQPIPYAMHLLFTDGVTNLGNQLPLTVHPSQVRVMRGPGPAVGAQLYTVASSAGANHPLLRFLAQHRGGAHLNLDRIDDAAAIDTITQAPFVFLGAEYDAKQVAEVTPSVITPVQGRFSLAGRLLADEADVTLKFGSAGEVTHKITRTIRRADAADHRGLVVQAWAKQRINSMLALPDEYRSQLVELGTRFGIVTPHTSLLVLETLDQHLAHQIPPASTRPKLLNKYNKQIKQVIAEKNATKTEKLAQVQAMWKQRVKWWEQEFKYPKNYRVAKAKTEKEVEEQLSQLDGQIRDARGPRREALMRERDALTERVAEDTAAAPRTTAAPAPTPTAENPPTPRAIAPSRPASNIAPETDTELRLARRNGPAGGGGSSLFSTGEAGGRASGSILTRQGADASRELTRTVKVKPWDPKTPYLDAIKKAGPDKAYAEYLNQRTAYGGNPGFYLDCAEHLFRIDERDLAVRVITGVLDLEMSSPPMMRLVAYRLQQATELDAAVDIFERVLKLRPEEPQSHRDLALTLIQRGERTLAKLGPSQATATPDHRRAVRLLNDVVMGDWDNRFPEIEVIALMEINQLIQRLMTLPSDKSVVIPLDPSLRKLLDLDLRIVMRWDTDLTDIDLWVIEPSGERCFYKHNRTRIGGLVSRDFTRGYGPEAYAIRKAMPGKYSIKAHYYGSSSQKVIGAATLHVDVITDFGRPTEERQAITVRLDKPKSIVDVGSVMIKGSPSTGE